MGNHPNRGKRAPGSSSPTPDEIRARRQAAGLTQTEAAALVHSKLRAWQQWEAEAGTAGHRGMHPALWELFTLKLRARASAKLHAEALAWARGGRSKPG